MLADISNVDAIYIVCRRTDMRKSIDGLCASLKTALLRYGHIIWKRYWLKNWKLLLVETLQSKRPIRGCIEISGCCM